jgi:2'-5' RNA ligase
VRGQDLYFIAVVPPSDIREEITTIKNYFADHYESKHALRSPPHITLHMPFQCKDAKLTVLTEQLSQMAKSSPPFDVSLEGFGAFAPRVIFVDVKENRKLNLLQKAVSGCMRSANIFNADYKGKPFHPHLTVAFRDLKKPMFAKAWHEFETKKYTAVFAVKTLSLLKHDGYQWQIFCDFQLGHHDTSAFG